MLQYLGEFANRLIEPWLFLLGTALDLLLIAVLALTGRSEVASVSIQDLLVVLFGLLLVSSFRVFQEERSKNQPTVKCLFEPHDGNAKIYRYRDTRQLQVVAPITVGFENHSTDVVRVSNAYATWDGRTLFGKWYEISRIPLVSFNDQKLSRLDTTLTPRQEVRGYHLRFEKSWIPDRKLKLPKKSRLTITFTFLGSPDCSKLVGRFRNNNWNDLSESVQTIVPYWIPNDLYIDDLI